MNTATTNESILDHVATIGMVIITVVMSLNQIALLLQ
jgi:hypothetical protein